MRLFLNHGPRRSLACAIGVMLLLLAVGCPTSPPADPPKTPAAPPAEALFEGWDQPTAALILTGDQHGYLEPCGCSEKQSGGFARRAAMFHELRDSRKWNVVGLDVGGTLKDKRAQRTQSQAKFAAILTGLNYMGYKALSVGLEELLFGSTNLYASYLEMEGHEGFDLNFVSANTTLFGTREGMPPAEFRVIDSGNLKIGVTSVISPNVQQDLDIAGITRDPAEVLISPIDETLPPVIEQMQAAGAELLVLLVHGNIKEAEELARKYPQFQVVATARSAEDPLKNTRHVGETLFCEVGQKGKNAAVVGIYKTDSGLTLKHELVELSRDNFPNHPSMTRLMQEYQDRLKAEKTAILGESIPDPELGKFVGVDQCKDCHTFAYSVWKDSKHAHAYESLIKGREKYDGEWVSRIYDPECLCCHTTGWEPQAALRFASGFVDMESTPNLVGQQCENCHGAGGKHVEAELRLIDAGGSPDDETKKLRDALKLNLVKAKESVCVRCHDYENSPNFKFEERWPKVNHSGKKN